MTNVALAPQQAATADRSPGGEPPWTTHQPTLPRQNGRPRGQPPPTAEKASRRRFTAEFKLQILHEADQCAKPGELGALLRREGLYSSHLCAWRRQREAGALAALAPKKRGRKAANQDGLAYQNQVLLRENEHLQARLRQAEMIIAMQAKVADALGLSLTPADAPATPPASNQASPPERTSITNWGAARHA